MQPLSPKWKAKPGNFDPLHALELFEGVKPYGIPKLSPEVGVAKTPMSYDDFRTARNKGKLPKNVDSVHFFIEDYRFEAVWNNPERTLKQIDSADFLITPDFSLYVGHPRAIQVWNTYRTRWIGAFWQSRGMRVIPSVCWSDAASHAYAFDGLPRQSTLAVAWSHSRDPEVKADFIAGYQAMCERLEPTTVLCYGETIPEELVPLAPLRLIEPWHVTRLRPLDIPEPAPKRIAPKRPKPALDGEEADATLPELEPPAV